MFASTSQDGLHRGLTLLHATPALRGNLHGKAIQPIQDLITLRDIEVDMATDGSVRSVRTVPDEAPLAFDEADGRIRFTVPAVRGHQMIEVAYG